MLRKAWFLVWFAGLAFSTFLVARKWSGRDSIGFLAERSDFRDVVVHLDLELDMRRPPELFGKARLGLREGTQGSVWLLLNRALEVRRAADESGRELRCTEKGRLRSEYPEPRVIAVELLGPTRELQLDYAGRGADGSKGSDWMGVLLVAEDELRMSPQTVFYPQIPIDVDGSGQLPWPSRVNLLAPADLEAFVPGSPLEWTDAPEGGRSWRWQSDAPTVLSLYAGRRERRETLLGEARVITLLTPEHANLGESIAGEAEKMLRTYAGLWGPIGARTLGVVEFKTRGASYNWASQGIIAMESGALQERTAPIETLAHETAHLWWGQEVSPHGRGERFLTESLAEYAAWRFLQSTSGEAAVEQQLVAAEELWWKTVHANGVDPPLFDVRFDSEGYTDLAYAKGPVALWRLQQQLGVERMDRLLQGYRERTQRAAGELDSADVFLAALSEHSEGVDVDRTLFEQPGHVHVGLRDVVFDGTKSRGQVLVEKCPQGISAPRIARATIVAHTETDKIRREIALDDRLAANFEVEAPAAILGLSLDPHGELPGRRVPAVVRSDVGFLSSEPEDGAKDVELGPLAARLRFGTPLSAPAEGFREGVQESCLTAAHAGKTPTLRVRSLALEEGGRTLVVHLDGTLPGREHVLAIPEGLSSAHGLPLPSVRVRFTMSSGKDLPRPRIVSTEPQNGARDVPASLPRLKIVFSEPMREGRGAGAPLVAELEGSGWTSPPLGESHWEDPRTLVWEFDAPLEEGRRYGMPFGPYYQNQLGIGMERFDLCFETAR